MKMRYTRLNVFSIIMFLGIILIAGCQSNNDNLSPCTNEKIELPFLDYSKISTFGKLGGVRDTGYFRVGRRYIHAPRVEFRPVKGASCYDLVLLQNDKVIGVTKAENSGVYAEKGWENIKTGKAGIAIIAYNKNLERIALSSLIPFYVAPDFSKEISASKKRSYKKAAQMAFDALVDFGENSDLGKIDSGAGAAIKHRVLLSACIYVDKYKYDWSFPSLSDWGYVEMLMSMDKYLV